MSLLLGRRNGTLVNIEPFHTLFAGQTNLSGKTTTIISLAHEAVEEGYTVLLFDSKPTLREFEGFHDIPVCYEPTTDPLILLGLVEAKAKRKFSPYLATMMRISERARNVEDVIANADAMEQRSRSGFIRDACHTLSELLRRVNDELNSITFSHKLELRDEAVNVIPMNKLSDESQQLVLKTAFDKLLHLHNRKTIVVVDEAFRFFPQDYSSACKKAGMDLITQGAKTKLFMWVSTQFIATTEKDVLKACANKLLGRQDDDTEIVATRKRVPGAEKLVTKDVLMTLKRGEFLFVPLEGKTVKVKVIPPWERSYEQLHKSFEQAPVQNLDSSGYQRFKPLPPDFWRRAEEVRKQLEKLGV